MKSPFPGMDPFMELRWQGLHLALIVYLSEQLNECLPADLLAQIDRRMVTDYGESLEPGNPMSFDRETEPFIEIVDGGNRCKLITVIEFVSPTTKLTSKGRASYLAKRALIEEANANFVEIDLTRAGDRSTILDSACKTASAADYVAVVHRHVGGRTRNMKFDAMPIDAPLPPITIPLRPTDQDVIVRLQPLVEKAYERGRYHLIGYSTKLKPPLSYAEQAFLEQRLGSVNNLGTRNESSRQTLTNRRVRTVNRHARGDGDGWD